MTNEKDTATFTHNKRLGQNFLSDVNLLQAIVTDADVTQEDVVLEIGAGEGSLTKQLCKTAKKVVAVEIDKRLEATLKQNLAEFSNVEIVIADFLRKSEEIVRKLPNAYKVVANIPYYITSPIVMFFTERKSCVSMTLTMQKEVAERICANENCKDYGVLSVLVQSVADAKICRIVDRKMFKPAPDVDSAVLKIVYKDKYGIEDYPFFEKVVKCCFAMRRKTLSNNLKNAFCLNVSVDELLSPLNIDANARGETLTPAQYVELYREIKRHAL